MITHLNINSFECPKRPRNKVEEGAKGASIMLFLVVCYCCHLAGYKLLFQVGNIFLRDFLYLAWVAFIEKKLLTLLLYYQLPRPLTFSPNTSVHKQTQPGKSVGFPTRDSKHHR